MEKLYQPDYFSCSEQIDNLKACFDKFKDKDDPQLKHNPTLEDTFAHIYGTNIAPAQLSSLPEVCSIEKLSVADEVQPVDITCINKHKVKYQWDFKKNDHFNLSTLQAQLDPSAKEPRKRDCDDVPLQFEHSTIVDFSPGDEILVTVRIYYPFSLPLDGKEASRLRSAELKFSQEIVVLGSQTLAVLRDQISCVNDKGLGIAVDDIDAVLHESNKDDFPSGLICINDHLFIDMRHPNAIDYSAPIKKWAKDNNIANFVTKDMKNVRIDEIPLRFGYPYLYQHRGDCEHVFVVSDAKLVKKTDSLCRKDYPFNKNISRYRTPHCNICQTVSPKWICIDCDRLPYDRSLLCHECLKSYNYVDGKKIGDFKIYPLINRSVLE